MTGGASEQEQRRGIASALKRTELTLDELWLRYFALGGTVGLVELEAYLHDLMPLPTDQRDTLAHAVNERLTELPPPAPAPYSRALRPTTPRDGPLAALVGLLEAGRSAPLEDVPALAAAAGRALDTRIVVYLVDHAQRQLTALPRAGVPGRERLGVDGTLAGRAFRNGEVLAGTTDREPRLWVPLLGGAERLGVLEVHVEDAADLHDPLLREQLGWVAVELGHLLTALSAHGDTAQAARPGPVRTAAAALVGALLPPPAATTAGVSVAGLLEPGAEVGGDAFDYALATTRVSLTVFGGMGYGLAAGLMASAALAASRAVRRDGHGVVEQARAVDGVVAEQFVGGLLTGVIAELDLATGRLHHVSAGQPEPLLLRHGQAVRSLTGGLGAPFGQDGADRAPATGRLERGDRLVLHTDGVTDARDAQGAHFGQDRLVDFLEREATAAHSPTETVRRLMHAVLAHRDGALQDDATVLLARWDAGSARTGGRLTA